MSSAQDMQYAYAVGRIRTIEKKLLDKLKIDRMVDAQNPEEALKILLEADYGTSERDAVDVWTYEALLKEEYKKVYKLLKEIAPQPQVFDMFLLKNDYHNIKVLLKAEFMGEEAEYLLIDVGTIPVKTLKVYVKERKLAAMHLIMKKAVEECLDSFQRIGDPQAIDLILDRATYKQMKEAADESGIQFIQELVTAWIDLENIKTFIRIKRMKKSWDFLAKVLIPGGSIKEGIYIEKLESSLESLVEAMKFTPYSKVCEDSIHSFEMTGSLTRLEKMSDEYIISFARKAKYIFLGIEPLVAYLLAKENEIKNARIILVGKINKIPNETIKERLREAYV